MHQLEGLTLSEMILQKRGGGSSQQFEVMQCQSLDFFPWSPFKGKLLANPLSIFSLPIKQVVPNSTFFDATFVPGYKFVLVVLPFDQTMSKRRQQALLAKVETVLPVREGSQGLEVPNTHSSSAVPPSS